MKIITHQIYRVHFMWQTLDERRKVRRHLNTLAKAGNEYTEIEDRSYTQLNGQTAGTIIIEVFEHAMEHIEQFKKKLS